MALARKAGLREWERKPDAPLRREASAVTAAPIVCVVEIPKGSRNKYEMDPELQRIKFDRFLFSSVVYPADYGYIPGTLATDGEPLDVVVLVSEPTFPGCRIEGRLVAVLRMRDEQAEDDKLLCVPCLDPNWNSIERLEDVPAQVREEIAHFFGMYKQPEGKTVQVDGWYPRKDAEELLAAGRRRHREQQAR
jgi:inorganic pyrophosphatase